LDERGIEPGVRVGGMKAGNPGDDHPGRNQL